MGVFSSEEVHSKEQSSNSSAVGYTRSTMHCQTVIFFAVVALATAMPAAPQKRQAYYFSPSAVYSNPYFGYSSYQNPTPYSSPSYQQRYLIFPPNGGTPSSFSGPYTPASYNGVEHIPPPSPGSYYVPPPPYQAPFPQPQEDHQPQDRVQHLAVRANGGLILVPVIDDETIGGSGSGSGTDYFSVLTNYLNQWISSKPSHKPVKPPVEEKPITEGSYGPGNKTPEQPEKAEKPAEAKPEGVKPLGESEPPKDTRPPSQRFLVITRPQLLNHPPSQDPSKGSSAYLILNNPTYPTPQRRYLDPYSQSPYRHPPAAAYPPVNQFHQPASSRSAMPEFILGKNENKYGFIHPSIADGIHAQQFAAANERRVHQPFMSQRRAFEDYPHDTVYVESALKDSSNAAPDDAASTTAQPNAGNGTSSSGDGEVVESGELGPSIAQVKPAAIALAGPGGVAAAAPVGTALVGPGGMALAAPSATAVAGPSGSSPAVVPAAAQAFANPATYRKQNKNKGQNDGPEYDVFHDSGLTR